VAQRNLDESRRGTNILLARMASGFGGSEGLSTGAGVLGVHRLYNT
jgi:hypothetical protein